VCHFDTRREQSTDFGTYLIAVFVEFNSTLLSETYCKGPNIIFIGEDYIFEETGGSGCIEFGRFESWFRLFRRTRIGFLIRITCAFESIDNCTSAVFECFGYVFAGCHLRVLASRDARFCWGECFGLGADRRVRVCPAGGAPLKNLGK
jgi:hypothetical protein